MQVNKLMGSFSIVPSNTMSYKLPATEDRHRCFSATQVVRLMT